MNSQKIIRELKQKGSKKKAQKSAYFFKTGKGEYGEGDRFWGVTVPEERIIAKANRDLKFTEIEKLLKHPFHEARLTGLFILVYKYEKTDDKPKKKIYNFYIRNLKAVNNWDLVDTTAPQIIGDYLERNKKEKKILYKLSESKNLWERRIAIVSTWYFIRKNDFTDTLKISEKLLKDKEDLIHKAVGWMLREVGKRNEKTLLKFLDKHVKRMPRTALRYSLERLSENKRKYYMSVK
jgi:3-methyladenine DNA glycosylase AlkD